ncbi:MAG: DUF4340 domain-containing protein [Bacteriovoracaceae bacterium]
MEIIRQKTRNYVSSWLLAAFTLGLFSLLAFSEIFQNVVTDDANFDSFSDPIKADILANIKTIRLKNRLGKFTVTLNENGQWFLIEPRKMPAPLKTIEKIIQSLDNLSIYTLHQKEPINLQSFSLDRPIAIMDLYTKLDERIQVKIGLVNPINNTSYMTISNHDIIFQTNTLKHKLELLELSDFLDSNIFSQNLADVKELSVFRGNNRESSNSLLKTSEGWQSKRYRVIRDQSVEKTIAGILGVKSHMIVDSKNEKIINFMDNYLKNPLYRINIKTKDGKSAVYTATNLLNSLPDLKIEKRQYFIMKSSERQYPHLIHKDYLQRFQIRYNDLK